MEIFEEIKQQVGIRQVIAFYGINVNRQGKFLCPFHADKHPSASIKNNYFNCFVCGAGGDAITFVSKMYGLQNIDAAKKIIEDFNLGIKINSSGMQKKSLRAQIEQEKRARKVQEEKNLEKLIGHTEIVLCDFHRLCYRGVHFYKANDKRFENGARWITQASYYLEEFEKNPKDFSLRERKLVKDIERRISLWDNC